MIFQIDGFLVCNTEEGEVKSAVANIFENGGEKMPIIQLGKIHFNAVVSGMLDLSEVIRSDIKRLYAINMKSGTIHRGKCRHLRRTNKKALVGAYLTRPTDAGLHLCSDCA